MDVIYLDYNASSPFPEALNDSVLTLIRDGFGNPSSLHSAGRRSRRLINDATDAVATFVGCAYPQIFWTSSGSEGNSWVIESAVAKARREHSDRAPRIIISAVEHESTMEVAAYLKENAGVVVDVCPVDAQGMIRLDVLRGMISQNPCDLVSVMYANNETGVIQPVEAIANLCDEFKVPYHCDAVQALGRVPLKLSQTKITYATFSAHKVGAPKGVGFVVVLGKGRLLSPIIHGKQQKALRGGTENVLGAALTGKILSGLKKGTIANPPGLADWQRRFESELKQLIPGVVIHGEGVQRLSNTTYVGFEGIDGDGVLMALDMEGVCASSGSACSSGSIEPSSVLLAMGVNDKMARSSVRFSSGYQTKWEHFEHVLRVLPEIVARARKVGSYEKTRTSGNERWSRQLGDRSPSQNPGL